MNTFLKPIRVSSPRFGLLFLATSLMSPGGAQGSEFYFDPRGPKADLPASSLEMRYSRGLKLYSEHIAILETTGDLSGGEWRAVGIVKDAHLVNPTGPEAPAMQFFRTISVERPTKLYVPESYDPELPSPLLLCLHGYSLSGEWLENLAQWHEQAELHRILLGFPDGTIDPAANPFWNASAGCCDFYGSGVDDSEYLRSLIETVQNTFSVDPKRIYVWGVSNGAFMAHRLARDHSDLIAAIIAIAGTMSADDVFQPSEPVSIQQIHGTLDPIDQTQGGTQQSMRPYLGARATIEAWAAANSCSAPVEDEFPSRDMYLGIPGNDTTVLKYTVFPVGGYLELLTAPVGHTIPDRPEDLQAAVDWFLAHPKP